MILICGRKRCETSAAGRRAGRMFLGGACAGRLTISVVALVVSAVALAAAFLAPVAALAQPAEPAPNGASSWEMDRVTTKQGRKYEGLILESDDPRSLEFVEIHRPPGAPMYLVIRPIDRTTIDKVERVDPEQRTQLAARIERFKRHAKIEADEMRQVPLSDISENHQPRWRFEGRWFTVVSTADEESTRRSIVRLEQVFRAFQQVLPPRSSPEKNKVDFRLFGTLGQYYRFARSQGVSIRNPAYYAIDNNQIVAGSDIRQIVREIEVARAEHQRLRKELSKAEKELPETIERRRQKLESAGVSPEEQRRIATATSQQWQERRAALERKITAAERRNRAVLDQVIDEMLRSLYHEAFHAYLANYVYSGAEYNVPRWLNEGLAQVFERGQLEEDAMRIDAADERLLDRLKADLEGPTPLRLADLLSANQAMFLVPHADSGESSARHYLYSWGLAYYLAFQPPTVQADALDRYVVSDAESLDPRARFESLTGMPLEEFETRWREKMLSLASDKP